MFARTLRSPVPMSGMAVGIIQKKDEEIAALKEQLEALKTENTALKSRIGIATAALAQIISEPSLMAPLAMPRDSSEGLAAALGLTAPNHSPGLFNAVTAPSMSGFNLPENKDSGLGFWFGAQGQTK